MESGRSGLLDKIIARISKILNKEQGEQTKVQGENEDQENLKQESWTDELRDLAPIDNVENFDTYEQTLNWAFQNERVKNIALSGPYGSGKSSIIETYLRKHEDVRNSALKVSLASFTSIEMKLNGINSNEKREEKIEISEEEVEKAILKQLFYAVSPEKIPLSRYRRVHTPSKLDSLKAWLKVLLVVVIIVVAINPNINGNLLLIFDKFSNNHLHTLARSAEILIVSSAISGAVYLSLKNNFSRIQISEIDLLSRLSIKSDGEKEESVFNRNLDEIIYYLENTKYRTVFFEDLDRLGNTRVFIHLRELNQLLNNNHTVVGKPIRFIYAVRDTIFTAEDRTKFFDFIIPVIPVISSANSSAVFLEKLSLVDKRIFAKDKNRKNTSAFRDFVLDIGPFISDMRTLNNVCNDFLIYQKNLKDKLHTSSDMQRLLAMIIFKNTCPGEFEEVQNEKGELVRLFTDKDDMIQEMKERMCNTPVEGKERKYQYGEIVNQMGNMSVKEIFEDKELRRFLPEMFQKNKIIMFMIRKGYIAGSYMNYINYFYEGGVTLRDTNFILSVKNQESLKYNYKIDNVKRVAQQLLVSDYREEAARNYDLLNYLLASDGSQHQNPKLEIYSRDDKRDGRLETIILNLAQWANESYEWKNFFDRFNGEYRWKLIRLLATNWNKMLRCILGGDIYMDYTGFDLREDLKRGDDDWRNISIQFSETAKEECIKEILKGCSIDVIKAQMNEVDKDSYHLRDELDKYVKATDFFEDSDSDSDDELENEYNNHIEQALNLLETLNNPFKKQP